MKEIILYDKLSIKIPDDFQECDEGVRQIFFGHQGADYAYSDGSNVYVAVKKREQKLDKAGVRQRTYDYLKINQRMVPGFQIGEMMIKHAKEMDIGIFTYKSNTATGELYNVLGVGNVDGAELLLGINADMEYALSMLHVIRWIVDSLAPITDAENVIFEDN